MSNYRKMAVRELADELLRPMPKTTNLCSMADQSNLPTLNAVMGELKRRGLGAIRASDGSILTPEILPGGVQGVHVTPPSKTGLLVLRRQVPPSYADFHITLEKFKKPQR